MKPRKRRWQPREQHCEHCGTEYTANAPSQKFCCPEHFWAAYRKRKRGSTRLHIARHFKISAAEYESLLDAQDGKCAICRQQCATHGKRLSIDHDHTTGKIRGLLCKLCNLGLGNFRDNTAFLACAITYLKEASGDNHPVMACV